VTDDSRPAPVGGGLPAEAASGATDPTTGSAPTTPTTPPASSAALASPASRRQWSLFAALALTIVVVDQLAKLLVTRALDPGQSIDVVGDLVRIVFGQNTGALFGLFKDNAVMFGVVSLVVVGLIVAYHARSAPSFYLTITLGFLLGGAIGNMVDRLRLGYVVDFVDAGIGPTRFYTFNVADSAITLAILLLFAAATRPSLVDGGAARSHAAARPGGGADGIATGAEDPWDDETVDGPAESSTGGATR
jgi:signal peptidase II